MLNPPLFLPPPNQRQIRSEVQWAELRRDGPWSGLSPRLRGNAAAGMRFERHTHSAMMEAFGPSGPGPLYAPAMWIAYLERNGSRLCWAQPDGLIIDLAKGQIIIVEIKLRHTQAAWWALRKLYEPLIRNIFGTSWHYAVCELVHWFDPAVPWPEPYTMTPNPSRLMSNSFGIHIWSGRDKIDPFR